MAERNNLSLIASCFVWMAASVANGQGILSLHQGAMDPVSEGFTLTGSASNVGPVMGDLGRDSWSIIGTGVPVNYFQPFTPEQQNGIAGADWTLSATLRIMQAPQVALAFYTGSQRFGLTFDLEPDGDPIINSHSSVAPVFVFDGGGSGYHDYELVYRATTGQASLWVDGVEEVTDITGVSGDFGWGLIWGTTVQGTASQANWNRVSFEVIPEPSTLALLGFGCGLFGFWIIRRDGNR